MAKALHLLYHKYCKMFGTIFVFALGCLCAVGLSVLALKFLFGTFFNTASANREAERGR